MGVVVNAGIPTYKAIVGNRRVRVIAGHIASLLPRDARVLDIGCGNGAVSSQVMKARPDVTITGVEVFVRDDCQIPATVFDGKTVPYEDDTFDAAIITDVLHHTDDPNILLREAKRVAKSSILLKDHTVKGRLARQTLAFMDWFSNTLYGNSMTYNFWTEKQWTDAFERLQLMPEIYVGKLSLYSWPATLLFDRSLHFIAKLSINK